MIRLNIKHALAIAGVTALVVSGVPVLAVGNGRANSQAEVHALGAGAGGTAASNGTNQAAAHQAEAQARLSDAKLKACQNRQAAIQNIMGRIADRGQKQLDLFGTIASRVETFYTDKKLTLNSYDTLVADLNTQHDAAQAAIDTVKSSGTGFDCNGSDPKGFVNTFKDSLKSEIAALQTYRTSVKNLIVGVKSVQGTTNSTTNTSTGGGTQ